MLLDIFLIILTDCQCIDSSPFVTGKRNVASNFDILFLPTCKVVKQEHSTI